MKMDLKTNVKFRYRLLNSIRSLFGLPEHVYIRDPKEIMNELSRRDEDRVLGLAAERAKTKLFFEKMYEVEEILSKTMPDAGTFVSANWTKIEKLYEQFRQEMMTAGKRDSTDIAEAVEELRKRSKHADG